MTSFSGFLKRPLRSCRTLVPNIKTVFSVPTTKKLKILYTKVEDRVLSKAIQLMSRNQLLECFHCMATDLRIEGSVSRTTFENTINIILYFDRWPLTKTHVHLNMHFRPRFHRSPRTRHCKTVSQIYILNTQESPTLQNSIVTLLMSHGQ